jgi:hypothetical protein
MTAAQLADKQYTETLAAELALRLIVSRRA